MTDATVKELKRQMFAAALQEEARAVLAGLRVIMADCKQAELIALAAFLGEEIAQSRQIPPVYRQEYMTKILKLIQDAYEAHKR